MKVDYKIHGIAANQVTRDIVTDEGDPATVVQTGMVVELVPVLDNGSGAIKLCVTDAFLKRSGSIGLFDDPAATIQIEFSKGK